jgi:hypothetical protein
MPPAVAAARLGDVAGAEAILIGVRQRGPGTANFEDALSSFLSAGHEGLHVTPGRDWIVELERTTADIVAEWDAGISGRWTP